MSIGHYDINPHRWFLVIALTLASHDLLAAQNETAPGAIQANFDVEVQRLDNALLQLAIQAKATIIMQAGEVSEYQSPKVIGHYTLDQALVTILKSTPFRYRFGKAGAIIIYQAKKSQPPSLQQQTEADNVEDIFEEIVVSGSHLRWRSALSIPPSRLPIYVVRREDVLFSSSDGIIGVANGLTFNSGSEFQNETGGLIGSSQFNIRGLGLGSSLVLINGRRAGSSPVADGIGDQFFDINQLPLSMVDRLEFLKDGASAIYGSQAVAGVVNIITRKKFRGLELSARQESASNQARNLDISLGFVGESYSLNLFGNYQGQSRNDRTNFPWLVERIHGDGDLTSSRLISSIGSPGSYRRSIFDSQANQFTVSPGSNTVADADCEMAGGILIGSRCFHNFADQVSVIPEDSRIRLFSEFSMQLSDRIELFAEAGYSNNRIERSQGPTSFGNGLVEDRSILIPANHPFNFFVDDGAGGISYVEPEDWDNGLHSAVDISCLCRPLGVQFNGTEDRTIDRKYQRAVTGLRVGHDGGWGSEWSISYSGSSYVDEEAFEWIADQVNGSVLNGSWNPFGTAVVTPELLSPKDGISQAGNSPELLRALWRRSRESSRTSQVSADALVHGSLYELAAGPVTAAFGLQYRRESLNAFSDVALDGEALRSRNLTLFPVSGVQRTFSYFVEAIVPLRENLELQAAFRSEHYSSGIGSSLNPKLSLQWQLNDWLGIRASRGESFQAPSIRQQNAATRSIFISDSASVNPVSGQLECINRGVTSNTIALVRGSNRLRPQKSDSFSFGVAVDTANGWALGLDYWQFTLSDLIAEEVAPQEIVDNDCSFDGVPDDPRITRDLNSPILLVETEFVNSGEVKTNGLDVSVQHRLENNSWGSFRFTFDATYVDTFTVKNTAGGLLANVAGSRNFRNQFRSVPRLRSNTSLQWFVKDHRLSLIWRYISSYTNDQPAVPVSISSWLSADLQYHWNVGSRWGGDVTLTSGINNLMDRDPPTLGDERPGYDSVTHNVRGREVYLGLTWKYH